MNQDERASRTEGPGEVEETIVGVVRWFSGTTDGTVAAAFRIALGLGVLWAGMILLANVDRYYTEAGLLPWKFAKDFPEQPYSILALSPTNASFVHAVLWVFFGAGACLTLGIFPRVATWVVFVIEVALHHRNPYVINGGDNLLLVLSFLAGFLPLGRRWSLTGSLLRRKDEAPAWLWSQRLIGLQICYIYLYAFIAKAKHGIWWQGRAMRQVFASEMMARHPIELTVPLIGELICYSTLFFEFTFPIFVWHPRVRRWYLAAGVLFHLGIEAVLKIHLFSAMMLISYVVFLTDDEVNSVVALLRRPFRKPVSS